jgi:hypothetical protein
MLYDSGKAWSSKNHSVLSGYYLGLCLPQRKIEVNVIAIRPGKLPKFQYMGCESSADRCWKSGRVCLDNS